MKSGMFRKHNTSKSVGMEILSRYKMHSHKFKYPLSDIEKADLLFEAFLSFIRSHKWKYDPNGFNAKGEIVLGRESTIRQSINCLGLTTAFVILCKHNEVGIKNANQFIINHKPTKKFDTIFAKGSPPLYPFDYDTSQFNQMEAVFDQHSVAQVGNKFYDLSFATYFNDIDSPFDNSIYGQIVSQLDAKNDEEASKLLLANPNIDLNKTFEGWTLLHRAACSGLIKTVKNLINLGANTNFKSIEKIPQLPLELVKTRRIEDLDKELFVTLSKGVNPLTIEEIKQFKSDCINADLDKLYLALDMVINNNINGINELLKDGLDIDTQDLSGWTLLHQAVQFEKADILNMLLNKGANRYIENDDKQIPIALCPSADSEVYRILMNSNNNDTNPEKLKF